MKKLILPLFLLVLYVATAAGKPNLIIIMADDMGYGDASCYGGEIPTPHLDRMAEQGMRFTDFHASGNVCSPTRAGLLTGRYQYRAGVPGVINADPKIDAHWWGLAVEEVTFADVLRDAGYQTALFGKWHLGYTKNFNPMHHGFDRFRGYVSGNVDYHSHYDRMGVYDWWEGLEHIEEEGYVTHLVTQHTVDYIKAHKDESFCVYVAHEAVHSPWQGPNDPPQRGPNKKRTKVDKQRALREMLIEMDQGVGEILDTVDALGIAENTFIMFFSDNGPAGGSAGPLRGRKGSNWEGGHRVPCIARWPGKIEAGSVNNNLAISIDVMPTMLALAGAKVPKGHELDGVNLVPTLCKGKSLGKRQLFWNYKAMRDGDWKLIIGGKGADRKAAVGLYNLADDIGEQHNLAGQHPERVTAMRTALDKWGEEMKASARVQEGKGKR